MNNEFQFQQQEGQQQEQQNEQQLQEQNAQDKEMKRIKKNKYAIVLLLLVILAGLSIGFAALSSQLNVQGTSTISDTTWDIGPDDDTGGTGGIEVPDGEIATINPTDPDSLTPDDGVPTPENPNPTGAVIWMDGNTVYFKHVLKKPGDIFTFNVTYANNGTINAKVANVTKSALNATAQNFLTYTATYANGTAVAVGDTLNAGSTVTFRITVEFKNVSTLPTAEQLALINETAEGHTGATSLFTVTYEQA